jgi:hypothetical protein
VSRWSRAPVRTSAVGGDDPPGELVGGPAIEPGEVVDVAGAAVPGAVVEVVDGDVAGPVTVVVGFVVVEVGLVDVEVDAVVVVVVEGGAAAHAGPVKVLLSNDTCPFRAKARPCTTVPVVTEIDVNAMIVPLNDEFVPRVAELPTCQKTLQAWAPLMRLTLLADAVMSVDAIWKMNTALASPWPSNVTVPLRASELVDL